MAELARRVEGELVVLDAAGRARQGGARPGTLFTIMNVDTQVMAGAPELPGVLGNLTPLLDHYGYLAIAGLIMLEDFGVPVPGEAVLIAGAIYAGAGHLNIFAVVVIAVIAAVTGDTIGYTVGRFGGRRLVLRFGHYFFLTPKRLDTAERFFARHGAKVVTVARFLEGLRQANGIVAGIARMPWRRFLAFNTLGAALWVAVWTGLGYLAGNHITAIYEQIHRYQRYALVAVGLVLGAVISWHLLRRRRTSAGEGAD